MSLYQRGNVWWFQFYQNKKRIRGSTKTSDYHEAKEIFRQKMAECILTGIAPAEKRRTLLLGIIYVIELCGYYKIGKTGKRLEERFCGSFPIDYSVIRIWRCRNIAEVERRLHERFANQRHRGEWFRLSPEDIDWIRNTEVFQIMQFGKEGMA